MDVKKQRKIRGFIYLLGIAAIFFLFVNISSEVFAQTSETLKLSTDKYRLVFPAGYEDSLLYDTPPKDKKEEKARTKAREKNYEQRRIDERASFLTNLNKAGSQNYRLLSAINKDIAITVLTEKQYEYQQIEKGFTRRASNGNSFEKWFTPLATQGFSLVDFDYTGSACSEDENRNNVCDYRYSFILERQKGEIRANQFRLSILNGFFGLPFKSDALAEQIINLLPQGFSPTHIFSESEILLQKPTSKALEYSDKSQILVATTTSSKTGILGLPRIITLPQSVNFLANQGYRMALTHDNIALMYRNQGVTSSVIYWWVDTNDPDFVWSILRLQARGSIYRFRSIRRGIGEPHLIFEQPTEPTKQQREYKILKLQLQETENFAAKKVTIDLTPAAKETMKNINQLSLEGYEVRDLFVDNYYVNGCSVLLERTPSK